MSSNDKVNKGFRSIRNVQIWQLAVLFILSAFISASFLRLNSIGMVQRREAVLQADEAGDLDMIAERLYDLQQFVSSHMNTSLGKGVSLEHSYSRAVTKWQEGQYGDSNPNGNIYKKAQEVCAPQYSSYSYAYLQCTTSELEKYPASNNPNTESSRPRQESFIHSFASPLWSPDFAGWSVLVTIVIGLIMVAKIISELVLRALLKRHYRQF